MLSDPYKMIDVSNIPLQARGFFMPKGEGAWLAAEDGPYHQAFLSLEQGQWPLWSGKMRIDENGCC